MALPPVILASIKFQRDSNAAYLDVRDRIGNTLSHLQEGIAGVRVVQAFAREDVEVERFAAGNRELYDSHMRSVAHLGLVPAGDRAGRVGHHRPRARRRRLVGARGHAHGRHGGVLRADAVEPVRARAAAQPAVQHGAVGRRRPAQAVRAARHAGRGGRAPGRGRPARRRATSRCDDVSFAYGDGPPVLRDVDAAHPGRVPAWRSSGRPAPGSRRWPSSSPGSTTRPRAQVRFGGVDLRDATLASLRGRIVVIPQEGFLFNGTIRDNVRLARAGATDAEVDDALRAVGRLRPVRRRCPTASTPRSASGAAACRRGRSSWCRWPGPRWPIRRVLVLDEATSSLDPGTEALVEAAVDRLLEGRTVVVIAHRLSTSERADMVGVVDGGELVELGPARRPGRPAAAPTPGCTPPGWRARRARRGRHAHARRLSDRPVVGRRPLVAAAAHRVVSRRGG